MNRFDLWLGRITSLSQLFLVVAAIATIKLTVIPLYQKELNSEELAKSQIKLNSVQVEIDKLQSAIAEKEKLLVDVQSRQDDLAKAEESSRERLLLVDAELKHKEAELQSLRRIQERMIADSAKIKGQLKSENTLKFYQALEWFSMVSELQRDCYNPEVAEIFENAETRKADLRKGCGPYRSLKDAIKSIRERRRDSSGDPLNISMLDAWLSVAENELEHKKVSLRSSFDLAVYQGLGSENLVKKPGESDEEFYKRKADVEKSQSDYSNRARDHDREAQKDFIRNLKLPS
ncbi:hypothetical protein [Pseudomonas monteilii]|uniref:hypothetical protein n=1 Tax=Pseudomonas monteilii TaxID=76759 RepID=UPI003F6DF39E